MKSSPASISLHVEEPLKATQSVSTRTWLSGEQGESARLLLHGQSYPTKRLSKPDEPPLVVIRNFLSLTECELLNKPVVTLTRCTVTDDGHNTVVCDGRTSSAYTPEWQGERTDSKSPVRDTTLRLIQERAHALLAASSCGVATEGHVIRYLPGERFRLHHDSLSVPSRYATLLVYLCDVPEGGGETAFPNLGLTIRPEAGTALLWRNNDDDGKPDLRMRHEGITPIGTAKWIVQWWGLVSL